MAQMKLGSRVDCAEHITHINTKLIAKTNKHISTLFNIPYINTKQPISKKQFVICENWTHKVTQVFLATCKISIIHYLSRCYWLPTSLLARNRYIMPMDQRKLMLELCYAISAK